MLTKVKCLYLYYSSLSGNLLFFQNIIIEGQRKDIKTMIRNELSGLEGLLNTLKSEDMRVTHSGEDVTQRFIDNLEKDIEHLKAVLKRVPSDSRDH